jgi:hypothetical protein
LDRIQVRSDVGRVGVREVGGNVVDLHRHSLISRRNRSGCTYIKFPDERLKDKAVAEGLGV